MKYYCEVCEAESKLLEHKDIRSLYVCPACDNRYVKLKREMCRITWDKWETFLQGDLPSTRRI